MIKHCFTICFLLVFGAATAQNTFSMEEAVDYGLANSEQVKIDQLSIQDAEARVKEYWAIGLPQLNGGVDYQHFFDIPVTVLPDFITPAIDERLEFYNLVEDPDRNYQVFPAQFGTANTLSWNVELQTLLFDGSFFVGLQAQRLYKEYVAVQTQQTTRDIGFEVRKAYVNVLIAEKNKETVDRNIANLEKLHFETEQTYEAGLIEQLDVDRLAYSLENLKLESKNLSSLIDLSKNLLKFQMGYPIADTIVLEDKLEGILATMSSVDLDNLSYAYGDRVEYQIIEKGELLNEMNIKQLKNQYLPSLYGFASYSRTQQGDKILEKNQEWFPSTVAGVSLSVPIWDSYDKKAKIQRASIGLDKVRVQKTQFEQAMDLEVANQRMAYKIATNTLQNRSRSLELAEKIYNTTQIKYKEGVGSSLELTQAEEALYAAQGNYENALYDVVVARIELNKTLGQ